MKSLGLAHALAHAMAEGLDVDELIQRHTPKRDWTPDPARLSAAEAKRERRRLRNLRNQVRS